MSGGLRAPEFVAGARVSDAGCRCPLQAGRRRAAERSDVHRTGPSDAPGSAIPGDTLEFFVVLYHIDGRYCGPFPCDSLRVPVEDRPEAIPSEAAHLFFRR